MWIPSATARVGSMKCFPCEAGGMLLRSLFLISLAVAGSAAIDTRLVDAAKERDSQSVRKLLQERADANAIAPDGATALHWAAHLDDIETARLLIKAGANA